ncbi:hypothetical protein [Paracoccus spongiarum]|uniref:Uncharacterized protein n=1 Tax=Paracoccus spongiarum TaxID=3064387 RepID=A0ABT9J8P4_9RHOB|nr:hypothetical protein [Paracoccus sp. 2205BS29-5]MDP5306000.1 hypothetical protein [Paracoccus sp. 2205BS29-5]
MAEIVGNRDRLPDQTYHSRARRQSVRDCPCPAKMPDNAKNAADPRFGGSSA